MTTVAEEASHDSGILHGSTARGLAVAVLTVSVMLAVGCPRKDPLAGLNELPAAMVATLRPAPNPAFFATAIDHTVAPLPPASPVAHCAANASQRVYDAQITTPIVLCTDASTGVTPIAVSMPTGGAVRATYKLTDASAAVALKKLRAPLVCTVRNGPWSATVIAARGCFGSCSPFNSLSVTGVTNNVAFGWWGALDQHPPGFEFVGTPTVRHTVDLGPCNPLGGGGSGGGGVPTVP